MAPFSVQGKTAVITGAGSGINLAFAQLLLSKGCNVVIADLRLRPEAEELLGKYSGAGANPRGAFVKTDVAAWEDLQNMLDYAVSEFGSFDIVCAGAGVFDTPKSGFWHPPGSSASRDFVEANHYTALDINLLHPIRTTQLALQHWLKPENAAKQTAEAPKCVISVASAAGYAPVFNGPLYTASKFGVIGFTRSLARLEADVGVRVSAVAPGVVSTPMLTGDSGRKDFVNDGKDALLSPQGVAEAMLLLVESEDHPGGTILEVGAKSTRKVSLRNDPGPSTVEGEGTTLSGLDTDANTIAKSLKSGTWQTS